jgi:hypothetical protein
MLLPTILSAVLILAADEPNAIVTELTEKGLPATVPGTRTPKLPLPTMADGLSAQEQRTILKEVAGKNRRVEDLLHDAVVSPFVLKITDIPGEGKSAYRLIDVWFVAYGQADRFWEEDFYQTLLEVGGAGRQEKLPTRRGTLDAKALEERGIQLQDSDNRKERIFYATVPVFDRVLLSVTRRILVTRQDGSLLLAAAIDGRFANDKQYPNQWRPLTRTPNGEFSIGSPQPYTASGSYAKITPLVEPAGALFIEHHQLLDEPEGWFDGKAILRSKLPLAVQDTVRKLRRQLTALNAASQP